MKKNIFAAVVFSIILFSLNAISIAQQSGRPPIPKLTSPVYDETGTLSSVQADALRRKLRANEDSTSTQIAIVIINSLNDYPASDFAITIGQENKIGQGKKNNGGIILLAKNDHQGFIATGYGLEPTLTDATAHDIFENILKPSLRENDYYGGLDKATDAIIKATAGEYKAEPKKFSFRRQSSSGAGAMIIVLIFFIILIVARGVMGSGTHRTVVGSKGGMSGCMGGILQGLFWSSIFSNRGGSGWGGGGLGGGGFSGGGGGGWSGGGGSFGGGGAGGSW
jgi:uncharacterized protein